MTTDHQDAGVAGEGELVIENAFLIDPNDAARDAAEVTLVVASGSIRELRLGTGAKADHKDASVGRWILPGLVNCHDHLYSHELRDPLKGMDLGQMRRWIDSRDPYDTLITMLEAAWAELQQGIALIRDLGAMHGLNTVVRRLIESGKVVGPRVVASGRPVVMTGGHVWTFGREADGPDECRKAVREQAKAGAEVIKIMASGGLSHYPAEDFTIRQYSDQELRAIIDEAHALGLRTCAHAFGQDAVERVVALGVDSVEHGIHIDDATLRTMADRGISYVPTLTNMERVASREFNDAAGQPRRSAELMEAVVIPQRETFSRAVRAGVRIGVGTDSTGDYGRELVRMSELGLPPAGVIKAATIDGAEICGVSSTTLAAGRPATLLVYDADPRDDLSRLTRPDLILINGIVVSSAGRWLQAPLWQASDAAL